jgi:DNA-directed RNA polymerase alpha subunit
MSNVALLRSPKLPDDTKIESIQLPTPLRNALTVAGITTVGEVREMSDANLLSFQNVGLYSFARLRKMFGRSRTPRS